MFSCAAKHSRRLGVVARTPASATARANRQHARFNSLVGTRGRLQRRRHSQGGTASSSDHNPARSERASLSSAHRRVTHPQRLILEIRSFTKQHETREAAFKAELRTAQQGQFLRPVCRCVAVPAESDTREFALTCDSSNPPGSPCG